MKKVSAKKYYEYFDDNVYRHEGVLHSVEYPSKCEVIDKYYIHGLKDKILCYHTEKYWERILRVRYLASQAKLMGKFFKENNIQFDFIEK